MNRLPFSVAVLLLAVVPISASVLLATSAPLAAQGMGAPSGGNGTFYISTYTNQIQVIDESTRTVIGRIETQNGMQKVIISFGKDI